MATAAAAVSPPLANGGGGSVHVEPPAQKPEPPNKATKALLKKAGLSRMPATESEWIRYERALKGVTLIT